MADQEHIEHVIPGSERRCVWMEAGLLSYQLCNRKFDCARCPIEASMRSADQRVAVPVTRSGRSSSAPPVRRDLSTGYVYTRNHWWLHKLDHREESSYRVGIEPFLAQLVAYPKEIVLPAVGTKIRMGECCAWIVLKGGTIPLRAPLSGTVVNINRPLRNNPQTLMSDPLVAGWMMEIKQTTELHPQLLDKKQAVQHYANEKERFTTMLYNATRRTALDVGTTLADGGSFVANLGEVIGQKKLYSLILEIINA